MASARKVEEANVALLRAAKAGDFAAKTAALDAGAGVDCTAQDWSRRTPLFLAARGGHASVVTLLLERGAHFNEEEYKGETPLNAAVEHGHAHVLRLLLQHGADPNAKSFAGRTPLHLSFIRGKESVANVLLERGANIHAKDDGGRTPLHWAAHQGSSSCIVTLLLELGSDVSAKDNRGQEPLFYAAQSSHTSIVALLLESGADHNAKCNDGRVALHPAAISGDASVMSLLLGRGADVNVVDEQGHTPLHNVFADEYYSYEDRDEDSDGQAPSYERRFVCAQLLLQRGAIITAQLMNEPGLTKLAAKAVSHRRRDLVFMLLWRGMCVEAPEGSDAASVTAVTGKHSVHTLLAEWQRGSLRTWRVESHGLFPVAFQTGARSLLLATLGSLDASAAVAQDGVDEATRAGRRTACRLQNPLRTLRERCLLEPLIQALLLAYMGGPPAPPLPSTTE